MSVGTDSGPNSFVFAGFSSVIFGWVSSVPDEAVEVDSVALPRVACHAARPPPPARSTVAASAIGSAERLRTGSRTDDAASPPPAVVWAPMTATGGAPARGSASPSPRASLRSRVVRSSGAIETIVVERNSW